MSNEWILHFFLLNFFCCMTKKNVNSFDCLNLFLSLNSFTKKYTKMFLIWHTILFAINEKNKPNQKSNQYIVVKFRKMNMKIRDWLEFFFFCHMVMYIVLYVKPCVEYVCFMFFKLYVMCHSHNLLSLYNGSRYPCIMIPNKIVCLNKKKKKWANFIGNWFKNALEVFFSNCLSTIWLVKCSDYYYLSWHPQCHY